MTEHGDEVDLALSELALSAVARLHVEMNAAKASKDRIAAANSILDRLGYGRATRAQADVADGEIRRALEAVAGTPLSRAITHKATDEADAQGSKATTQAPHGAPADFVILDPLPGEGGETDAWLTA